MNEFLIGRSLPVQLELAFASHFSQATLCWTSVRQRQSKRNIIKYFIAQIRQILEKLAVEFYMKLIRTKMNYEFLTTVGIH